MSLSRRRFLATAAAAASTISTAGCVGPHVAAPGHRSSYTSRIVSPQNRNTVFHWVDAALQQVRDQRIPPPRAAYTYALPMACGFLAANGIVQAYDEPFGIGHGPPGTDPEVAYGVAFASAAAEAFQQPFLFERMAFLDRFPGSEAKTLGVEWGRAVGRQVLRMRTNDGSEPSEVNYYLGRYRRRTDSLRWRPTGPFYAATPGPASRGGASRPRPTGMRGLLLASRSASESTPPAPTSSTRRAATASPRDPGGYSDPRPGDGKRSHANGLGRTESTKNDYRIHSRLLPSRALSAARTPSPRVRAVLLRRNRRTC